MVELMKIIDEYEIEIGFILVAILYFVVKSRINRTYKKTGKFTVLLMLFSITVNAQFIEYKEQLRVKKHLISQSRPNLVWLDTLPEITYTLPTNQPAYLVPFTNEFGNLVTRISSDTVFGVNSTRLKHNYSTDQAFNFTGEYIKLGSYPAAILDGNDYSFLYWRDLPANSRWLRNEPNYVIGTPSNYLYKMNVPENTAVTLHTFTEYTSIDTTGKGNLSENDRYIALVCNTGSQIDIITYDLQELEIVGIIEGFDDTDLNWVSVSPSGTYVIFSFTTDGSGSNQGYKKANLDLTGYTHLHNNTAHADMGFDTEGNEVICQFRTSAETTSTRTSIETIRLSNGTITPYFHWVSNASHAAGTGIYGGHISMRSTNRKGYAIVTEECCPEEGVTPLQVFGLILDSSNRIEQWSYHHSNVSIGYDHQPHAVPNWSGSKVLFATNWQIPAWEALAAGYTFVVETPNNTLSLNEHDSQSLLDKYCVVANMLGQIVFEGYETNFKPKNNTLYAINYNQQKTVKRIYAN